MARYQHLSVKRVDIASIAPRPKEETPRQRAIRERDEEIEATLNEAATLPASQAVAIEPREGQKLATLRAAISRKLAAEPRDVNIAIRDGIIYISKGELPRRGRRPSR